MTDFMQLARVRCFVIEETGNDRVWLRRYATPKDSGPCGQADGFSYHNARVLVGDMPGVRGAAHDDGVHYYSHQPVPTPPPEDPRWPDRCERCDYRFQADDARQVFHDRLMARLDTGAVDTIDGHEPGAMWDGWWFRPSYVGPDGKTLVVKLPDGREWIVDSVASNCTKPKDREHRCWVRSGAWPDVTVGKGGNTCDAGAGSILTPKWHGFLRGGWLERC